MKPVTDQPTGYTFDRLNKSDAALLVIDHQIGLSELVRDYDPTVFRQSLFGHSALGNLFDLPTILTTSAESGPNSNLPEEIIAVSTILNLGACEQILTILDASYCSLYQTPRRSKRMG